MGRAANLCTGTVRISVPLPTDRVSSSGRLLTDRSAIGSEDPGSAFP